MIEPLGPDSLNPFDPDSFVISAEVHIIDIEPGISRTLELPVKLNLAQLHEVLQAAFGWTDSHLHQFNVGGLIIGAPEFDEDGLSDHRTFEASEVRLQDLTFPYDEDPQLSILYEYDFGDYWRHLLILRRIPRQIGVDYPRCLAGSRSGPPENVGGCSGYAGFLEAWIDPSGSISTQPTRPLPGQCEPQKAAIGSGTNDQSDVTEPPSRSSCAAVPSSIVQLRSIRLQIRP
jgi:hypothetical protein